MFGLVAIAAVSAMAFVGATSAAAEPTALCTVNTALICPAGNIYTGHIEAKAVGSPELLNETENVKCTGSTVLGNALGLANPLVGHLESLTFTGCKSANGFNCTTTTPVLGTLLLLKTAPNLGTLQSHTTEVTVSCASGLLKCRFGGLPTLHAEGGNPGLITASKAALGIIAKEGFVTCPKTAEWDAKYEIVLPKPIFITN